MATQKRQLLLESGAVFATLYLFSLQLWNGPVKLECLLLIALSSLVQCLQGRPELTQVKHISEGFAHKHLTRLQKPARNKRSSLLGQFLNCEENEVF